MNQRTLEVLEYTRVRETIAGLCASAEGKEALLLREPSTDTGLIARLKSLSSAWMVALSAETPPAFTGWPPIRAFLSRIRVEGASLSVEELFALGLFCDSAEKFRAWAALRARQVSSGRRDLMSALPGEIPASRIAPQATDGVIPAALAALGEKGATDIFSADGAIVSAALSLPDLSVPSAAIFRVIDRSGEIRDLPELRAIRQGILKIRQDIERLVGRYLSDDDLKGALQSTLPTIRDGRQVIALRSSLKSRVRGIVHEVSQSGQTVYVEPEDVVDRNNDLVTEEHRLSREIARILRELTSSLAPHYEELAQAHELMVFFDGIGAAARWGRDTRGNFAGNRPFSRDEDPALFDDDAPLLAIRQARHPLLGARAVPIDLVLSPGGRVLIITGPNTGGKTVTLKTVALFALLNQSGWPVPADLNTSIPIFDYVGCDIGDEQSLDQSLSTFSGHMKNIAAMMESAGNRSLVLLDELGSGTDPQEGSAIAMAVLDALLEKGSCVLATTHHGILKNYGYTHKACINASVDFDENTLSPTYRILMGVPGESHALDIAFRNGLDPRVVDQARSYLLEERADVSALIRGLTAKHEELDRFEQVKREEEDSLRERRRKTDLRDLQLRQKENELRAQGYRKLENLLAESRKQLENLVREIREGELTRDKTLQVKSWMADLERRVAAEAEGLDESRAEASALGREVEERIRLEDAELERAVKASKGGKLPRGSAAGGADSRGGRYAARTASTGFEYVPEFAPGVEVYVGASRSRGMIVREAKKGQWIVTVGTLKMTCKGQDLSAVPVNGQKKNVTVEYHADLSEGEVPAFELRLLGMRHDEAVKALERQLDLAAMKGLKEFSVVHGKGNGVLQSAVHEALSRYAGVAEFHFAHPEQGGTGKTVVTMK